MKYYYLINNRIMSANEKMPDINEQWHNYNSNLLKWSESLQPCEISESELEKVKGVVYHLTSITISILSINNPIEVTDIVEEKSIRELENKYKNQSSGTVGFAADYVYKDYIFFKQPKQVEEIEAVGYVAILHGRIISGVYKSYDRLKEDYPSTEHCKLTNFRNI